MKVTYSICSALRFLTGHGRRPYTAAVILAAGNGTRMQMRGEVKQLMMLEGKPVLAYSLLAFARCPYVDEIVVVTRPCDIPAVTEMARQYGGEKVRRIVAGGETRQDSAWRGFCAVSDKTAYVALHDAARCLVTSDMISDVVAAAYAYRAASAGTPVQDTIKQVYPTGFVAETPERSALWTAQTPQVFEATLYRAAAYTAREKKITVTDDNALVERLGAGVKMIDCGPENRKLTTETDLLFAQAVLACRAKKGKRAEEESSCQ